MMYAEAALQSDRRMEGTLQNENPIEDIGGQHTSRNVHCAARNALRCFAGFHVGHATTFQNETAHSRYVQCKEEEKRRER